MLSSWLNHSSTACDSEKLSWYFSASFYDLLSISSCPQCSCVSVATQILLFSLPISTETQQSPFSNLLLPCHFTFYKQFESWRRPLLMNWVVMVRGSYISDHGSFLLLLTSFPLPLVLFFSSTTSSSKAFSLFFFYMYLPLLYLSPRKQPHQARHLHRKWTYQIMSKKKIKKNFFFTTRDFPKEMTSFHAVIIHVMMLWIVT